MFWAYSATSRYGGVEGREHAPEGYESATANVSTFTNNVSSLRVRFRSMTNTQGKPQSLAHHYAFAERQLACPGRHPTPGGLTVSTHDDREPFAAFIGLDWADKKHDVCLRAAGQDKLERSVVAHQISKLDAWALSLRERFGGRPVAVCLELTRGPIVSALLKYDFFVLYPVNPQSLARYREAFAPSRAKDDPTDAELALELLCHHRDRLRPLRPESAVMRTLQRVVESRRTLVGDRVRLTNRIVAALKAYFPQVLEWFEDRGTRIFCAFLERWNSVEAARRAQRRTLESFFHGHGVRRPALVRRRIEAIRRATALTADPGVVEPARLLVQALIPQLRAVLDAIDTFDEQIAAYSSKHDDYALFSTLPGAGPTLAPRLLAAFGEDRDRYPNANSLQRSVGIAPVTERSGKKCWVHWRLRCNKFLRQTFVEWAAQTVLRSFWAHAYYHQQRARGASHQATLRSLAFKWIRILFRCWQNREPYDENLYLIGLRKKSSPLLKTMANHIPH